MDGKIFTPLQIAEMASKSLYVVWTGIATVLYNSENQVFISQSYGKPVRYYILTYGEAVRNIMQNIYSLHLETDFGSTYHKNFLNHLTDKLIPKFPLEFNAMLWHAFDQFLSENERRFTTMGAVNFNNKILGALKVNKESATDSGIDENVLKDCKETDTVELFTKLEII